MPSVGLEANDVSPFLILAALFAFMTPAHAMQCAKYTELVEVLDKQYGETRRAHGMAGTQTPQIAELYVSEAGTWTLLLRRPDGIGCIYAAGQAWGPVDPTPSALKPQT